MKKLFTFLSVLLCLALYSGAMAESFCWMDDYGCYVTNEDEQKSYLMFWSEAARQTVMGDLSQPGDLVVAKPANHSERLPLDPAPSPTPNIIDATLVPTALPTVVPTAVPTAIPTVAPAERWLDSPFTAEDGTRCLEVAAWSVEAQDSTPAASLPGWPWTEQYCIDQINSDTVCSRCIYNYIYLNLDSLPTTYPASYTEHFKIQGLCHAYGCGYNLIFPEINEAKVKKILTWNNADPNDASLISWYLNTVNDQMLAPYEDSIEQPGNAFYACYYNYLADYAALEGKIPPATPEEYNDLAGASHYMDKQCSAVGGE